MVEMEDGPDPRFRTLTADALRALPDGQLAAAVYHHVLHHILPDLDHEVEIVAHLPKAVAAIYTTTLLENEVVNGGFNQFFWNSTGKLALMALEGLEVIGALRHAAILRLAMATYESERVVLEQFRTRGTSAAFTESYKHTSLGALDEQYHELGPDALAPVQVRFIRDHLDEFNSCAA